MQDNSTADELPIEEYFVPLTANSDDNDYPLNDYCDYENFSTGNEDFRPVCRRSTFRPFPKKVCKKQGSKRIEHGEIGMTMHIRLSERKPKPEILRTEAEYDINEPAIVLPTDCCHHNKEPHGKRKFIISFGANSIDVKNDCLHIERSRCQAFWKFIDSQPHFLSLIKEGEFENPLSSPRLIGLGPTGPKAVSNKCKEGEILRAKHKAMKDEERERTMRRRRINEELEKKSGQRNYMKTKGKPKVGLVEKKSPDTYADTVSEPFADILREMKIFDDIVGNPVSIGSISRATTPSNFSDALEANPSAIFADDEAED